MFLVCICQSILPSSTQDCNTKTSSLNLKIKTYKDEMKITKAYSLFDFDNIKRGSLFDLSQSSIRPSKIVLLLFVI